MATMRYRSTPKPPKVSAQPKAGETGPTHSGLVPSPPPAPDGGRWSLESYPYADPKLADPEATP